MGNSKDSELEHVKSKIETFGRYPEVSLEICAICCTILKLLQDFMYRRVGVILLQT
jgi:hypothetical protein